MLSMDEVWGAGKIEDPISEYFSGKIEDMKLVDIVPNLLCHAWSNGRCGAVGLAKILDRFLLVDDLCDNVGKYRTWSHSLGFFIIRLFYNKLISTKVWLNIILNLTRFGWRINISTILLESSGILSHKSIIL